MLEPPCHIHVPVALPACRLSRLTRVGGSGIHSQMSLRRVNPTVPSSIPCPPNIQRLPVAGSVQVELPQREPGAPPVAVFRVPYVPGTFSLSNTVKSSCQ